MEASVFVNKKGRDIAKLRGSPKALGTAALLKRRVQQVV
jgi:hypothetical protein